MSRSWKGGSTRQWRKLRLSILVRDSYRCQLRLAVCTTVANHVHHTLGRAVTGDDPRYLVGACQPCNLHIGDPSKHSPQPRPVTKW